MRKRSKSILAIMMAASVMSGTGSLSVVAADFSSEEILEVEGNFDGETGVSQEAGNLRLIEDQESDSEEELFTEDNDLEEPGDIEENEETSSEVGIQEESVATYGENDGQSVDIGVPVEDFSDTEDVGDPTAGSYGVKVAGIWVTPENKDDILGDGTVSYDAENHKLTLNNAHISFMDKTAVDVGAFIYFYLRGTDGKTAESATLELKGDNIIDIKEEDKWNYIDSVGDLTITGNGSLKVKNNYDSALAVCNQSLTIEKVTLDFDMESSGDPYDPWSVIYGGNVEIRNKAKLRLEKGMIRQSNTDNELYGRPSGKLVISDSIVTCGNGIEQNGARGKSTLIIENSWVDLSGKIFVDNREISNSVVFEENNGTVTGNAVVPGNVEVRKDHTLTISEPNTLTIPSGLVLTNNGVINAHYCKFIKGTVTGIEPVYTHGQLTQWVNDKKSHWKECIDCGTKFQETAHTYGSWKTYRKPSVGVAGEREHSCKVCNYAKSGTIPALQVLTLNIKGGKKAISLNWNKMSDADGYKIYGTECGKKSQLKKTVSKNTLKWTEKKLKTGTYYKYFVVAYKKVNGKETVLAKSDVMHVATAGKGYGYAKKISLKSTSLTLKKGKSAYIKASLVSTNKKYNKKIQEHVPRIRFTSSDQAVATVNSKGKVTARAKGTCYIYCYGLNGVSRKVKITVK